MAGTVKVFAKHRRREATPTGFTQLRSLYHLGGFGSSVLARHLRAETNLFVPGAPVADVVVVLAWKRGAAWPVSPSAKAQRAVPSNKQAKTEMKWAARSGWRGWDEELYVLPASRLDFAGADFTFRRGLASNLYRPGVSDQVVQAIIRHSKPMLTRERYIRAFLKFWPP
jgi:hypothetical protein